MPKRQCNLIGIHFLNYKERISNLQQLLIEILYLFIGKLRLCEKTNKKDFPLAFYLEQNIHSGRRQLQNIK